MARLAFRQGIVSHQSDTSNNPTFLSVNGNYVDLVVSPDPTIIAFIHRTADYLYTESVSESQAWGPLDGTSVWLYWDLDATTGLVTKGLTDLQPIESPNTPQNPAVGQMWFNSTTNQWHEYTGSRFAEVIRVFAAHLLNGSTLQSMANNPVDFTGTQVGINTSVTVGSLLFTSLGNPIIGDNNMFFTSEDRFFAGVPSGSALRISNIIMTGEAVNNMAAYSVVQYNDFNQIGTANPFVQGLRLYGIIETDAVIGDSVNFIPEGMIVNEDWDWIADGATVNDPVYVSATGTIVLTPAAPQQLPVGVVTGQQEIMFAPRLFPQVTVNASTGSTDSSAAQQNALDIANHVQSITNHDDIDTTQANVDDVLTWNGSIWEPSPPTATAMSSGGVTSQDLQDAIDGVEAAQAIVDQAQDDAATAEETDDDAVNAAQDALISANNTLAQANATLAAANATLAHDGGVQDAAIATLSDEQDDLAELVTDNASDIVDLQNDLAAMTSGSTPVASSEQFFVPMSFNGILPDDTVVAQYVVPTTSMFAEAQQQPIGTALVPSSDDSLLPASFSIQHNGNAVGTVTFDDSNPNGITAIDEPRPELVPSDVLTVVSNSLYGLSSPAFTFVLNELPTRFMPFTPVDLSTASDVDTYRIVHLYYREDDIHLEWPAGSPHDTGTANIDSTFTPMNQNVVGNEKFILVPQNQPPASWATSSDVLDSVADQIATAGSFANGTFTTGSMAYSSASVALAQFRYTKSQAAAQWGDAMFAQNDDDNQIWIRIEQWQQSADLIKAPYHVSGAFTFTDPGEGFGVSLTYDLDGVVESNPGNQFPFTLELIEVLLAANNDSIENDVPVRLVLRDGLVYAVHVAPADMPTRLEVVESPNPNVIGDTLTTLGFDADGNEVVEVQ